jgi:ankyrin repeat protein
MHALARMPLLEAVCRAGNTAVVKFLLQNGANVHDRLDNGRTALHFAEGQEIIDLLLEYGADLKQTLASPWHFKMDSRRPHLMRIHVHKLISRWRRSVRVDMIK